MKETGHIKEAKIIVTADGERYAAIPLEEFRAFQQTLEYLVDELEDLRAEQIAGRIDRGEEELIPSEMVRRVIVDDEQPLKVIREWRGLSQEELAQKAGTTKGYISQIETRHRKPGRKLLFRLAKALDVPLDLLLEE